MPVRYRIVKSLGLVHSVFEGLVTFEESFTNNLALRADEDFDPSMLQLSDARTATAASSADEIRALAKNSPFGPASRRAVLVADDDTFGVTRMYTAQASDAGEVRIFRDEAEALEWLGVTADALESGPLEGGAPVDRGTEELTADDDPDLQRES